MRHFIALFLVAAVTSACAGQASPEGEKQGAAEAAGESASAVIEKHINAIGGASRWKAISTLKLSGKYIEGDKVSPFNMLRERPNRLRKEFQKDGKTVVKVFDGTRGFMIEGDKVTDVPAEHLAKMRDYAQFDDALLDYEKKGHKVELAGTEDVKGSRAYKLHVTLKNGDIEDRYIDASSYLEVKRVVTFEHEGKKGQKALYFGDYRTVDGVKINFSMEAEHEGKTSKTVFEEISFGRPIEASAFKSPNAS